MIGQPEVFVEWETATEIDTAGFYVQRSLTNGTNSYTRVSGFEPAEGDSVTGALYDWIDETTTLNTTYYYRLEEIPTDAAQPSIMHDPVLVVAGGVSTNTPTVSPTATHTPTPTPTRTPTLTLTPRPGTTSTNTPVPTDPPVVIATPQPATGATVTPRAPTGNVGVPPTSASADTRVPGAPTEVPQLPLPTPLPGNEPSATPVLDQSAPPNEVAAAPGAVAPGAAAPLLAPTLAVSEAVGPVVVVTESAAPGTRPAEARSGGLFLIMGAAVLLLVGAFLMLRQASK